LRTRLKAGFEILSTRNIIASQITGTWGRSQMLWTPVWRNFVMRQHRRPYSKKRAVYQTLPQKHLKWQHNALPSESGTFAATKCHYMVSV